MALFLSAESESHHSCLLPGFTNTRSFCPSEEASLPCQQCGNDGKGPRGSQFVGRAWKSTDQSRWASWGSQTSLRPASILCIRIENIWSSYLPTNVRSQACNCKAKHNSHTPLLSGCFRHHRSPGGTSSIKTWQKGGKSGCLVMACGCQHCRWGGGPAEEEWLDNRNTTLGRWPVSAWLVKTFKWNDSQGTLSKRRMLLFARQLALKDIEDKGQNLIWFLFFFFLISPSHFMQPGKLATTVFLSWPGKQVVWG